MARPRTEVDEAAIVSAWKAGTSMSAIALDHDLSRDIVRRVVRDHQDAKVLAFPSSYAPIAPDGQVTSVEICERARITYRQLDYWVRAGLLRTTTPENFGSGSARFYLASEIAVAHLMQRLISAGLAPRIAHSMARDLIETGSTLLAGMTVHLAEEV